MKPVIRVGIFEMMIVLKR